MTRISIRHASTTSLLAISMAGLLVMVSGTAQAAATTVPLGTAGTYAILAGSGITNTGITTINGDVGSSPTASASGTFGMSGTLTLDGANNPNSVFIFQTASTLITGGTGNINLIRGAQACNIFWKVGSAATIGAGSTLDGTVMAHDSISLGSGVTVLGRLFAGEQASGTGAVTLIHDTIIRSVCAAPVPTPTASASAIPS